MRPIIVYDPGHGGNDPGALGPGGLREKDITLAIAQRAAELTRVWADVKLTRSTDVTMALANRVAVANKAAAHVFVSIHCNSSAQPGPRGTETFHMPGSVAGLQVAQQVHHRLVDALGWPNRGIKTAKFHVLVHTNMPATLVEVGFINHPEEGPELARPATQDAIARAIDAGLQAWWAERQARAAR